MSSSHFLKPDRYHVLKVLVEGLHQVMDELQEGHLILRIGDGYLLLNADTHDEEQAGVAPVNDLVAPVLDEGAQRLVAGDALADEFALEGRALLDGHLVVVLGDARLALLVHHQQKLDHFN